MDLSTLNQAAPGASAASQSSGGSAGGDRAAIAENFDAFLNLLVTQLKNQNPLDPLDTNEFTQQLVQFASVEQEIKANEEMVKLTGLLESQMAMATVNYVGASVTAEGAASDLVDGSAQWSYSLSEAAPETTVTIRNAAGNAVFSEKTSLERGPGTYTWDGTTNEGTEAPGGRYSITIDARDADGGVLDATTRVSGLVEGIDFEKSEPMLIVNGQRLPLDSVLSVNAPGRAP